MNTLDTLIKVGGWVGTALLSVWIMSRRTQGWDRGNQSWLQLNGDKDSKNESERTGLIEQYKFDRKADAQWREQLENAVSANTDRTRGLQDGINAHGSRSDIIAQNARRSIENLTREAVDVRVAAVRRSLIQQQHEAFDGERERDSFVEIPNVPPPRPLPPRPDPKPPFNPEDTGGWKRRR